MNSNTDNHASEQALQLLLTNQFMHNYNVSSFKKYAKNRYWTRQRQHSTPDTKGFLHPTICSCSSSSDDVDVDVYAKGEGGRSAHRGVQESTSTLLAARALVKANRTSECWAYLDSLFTVQSPNGFLPKYRYFPIDNDGDDDNNNNDVDDGVFVVDDDDDGQINVPYYYKNTRIPASKLFNSSMPKDPCPQNQQTYASTCFNSMQEYTFVHELNITSSGRLSALPIHATSILEIFYLSNQTSSDLNKLEFYFGRLYKMHSYWLDYVMKYCDDDISGNKVPCYNIIHPWESLVDDNSPQWGQLLSHIDAIIKEEGWEPPPGTIIRNHNPPNDDVDKAMIYLLQCHADATNITDTVKKNGKESKMGDYEEKLIKRCPFAMLDVSHLAVLTRSNYDLYQIGKILHDLHSSKAPSKTQLVTMEYWIDLTARLNARVWNEELGRYASRNMLFQKNQTSQEYDFVGTEDFSDAHNAADLMVSWNIEADSARFMSMVVFPLLDKNADFSFNCGSYPIRSWACHKGDSNDTNSTAEPTIQPLINYWVSLGLENNGANGLGKFVQQSTLQFMCQDSYEFDSMPIGCSKFTFSNAYNAQNGLPAEGSSSCDLTTTASGAILYNLLVPDKPLSFKPSPPIQNGWVIVLVVALIMVVFSIGLSCLLLSLNMMRRLKKDADEYALIQLAREQSCDQPEDEDEEQIFEEEEETLGSLFRKFCDN